MKFLIFSFAAFVALVTTNSTVFAAAAPASSESEHGLMARVHRALRYAQEHPFNVTIGVAATALVVVCVRRLGRKDLELRLKKLEELLRSNPDKNPIVGTVTEWNSWRGDWQTRPATASEIAAAGHITEGYTG